MLWLIVYLLNYNLFTIRYSLAKILLRQALHPLSKRARRRAGAAHRPAGEADARLSTGPLRHLQLSRLHHRPGRGDLGTGGRPSPPRRDRECHPRPQVRRGAQPSPVRPFRRQRRLAGDTGDGSQPGPLDGAHRSGRAGSDHQDPTATFLLPRRTAHPLGTPPDPASTSALALGGPVHSRPDPIAHPAASNLTVALLTAAPATGPPLSPSFTSQSDVSPTRAARIGQREFPAAFGHPMRGPLTGNRPTMAPPARNPLDNLVSIPVMSRSSAPTTRFVSRASTKHTSGAEQKCTTREVIGQRKCPRQLFGRSVTEAGWQQAG